MEGRQNESKMPNTFKNWLEGKYNPDGNNTVAIEKFCADNYIPLSTDLDIKNFEEFYQKRKELLEIRLKTILTL